jgi:outer membrane protein
MRKVIAPLSGVLALVLAGGIGATPALAQDDMNFQVKLLGTAILPDGKISRVNSDAIGLPAGTQTKATDSYIPTVAIEYFFTPNVSLETICCLSQHDVDISAGPLDGAEAVSNARVIPATFTLKYHFNPGGVSPYVGAGPSYFLWVRSRSGTGTVAAGAPDQDLSDELGFALQAGLDAPVNEIMTVSLDAKRYWMNTRSRWYDGTGSLVLDTKHKLDPWVLSAGVGFRF